jgi:hypothetical protein
VTPKVLITGTGRAGTTLLVQVLTDLGLDTGFAPDAPIDERARAGLESAVVDPAGPRIVKSPGVVRRLGTLLDTGQAEIEHVIIPMRDLDVAAASRVRLTHYGADLRTFGGLVGTRRATQQREALAVMQYELMFTIARHDLPCTFLVFPRFTTDWEYTADKLGFLAPDLPATRWRDALASRVRPELIHEAPLTRREHAMTALGTSYNQLVVRPARAAGKP